MSLVCDTDSVIYIHTIIVFVKKNELDFIFLDFYFIYLSLLFPFNFNFSVPLFKII